MPRQWNGRRHGCRAVVDVPDVDNQGVGMVMTGGGLLIVSVMVGILYGMCEFGAIKRVFLVEIIVRTVVVEIVNFCLLGRVHVGLMLVVIGTVV